MPQNDESIALYWRYRRRTAAALVAFAAGALVAWVFRKPEAWDPAGAALAARYVAWAVMVIAGALAFRWNGMLCEQIGFCRGKHGAHPSELSRR